MGIVQIEPLALLRVVVGYLGEREQYGWWQSSFFTPGSKTFLAPVFGRTQVLAQCTGVTRAAAMVHDDRIGIGNIYHLFRLHEDIEQGIYQALYQFELCEKISALIANKAAALDYLQKVADPTASEGIGPTHVGDSHALRYPNSWVQVAAHYWRGFNQKIEIYPYFIAHT